MTKINAKQREVYSLLVAEGLCYKEIAARTGLSYQVVKNYMNVILNFTGADSATQLVCWHHTKGHLLREAVQ